MLKKNRTIDSISIIIPVRNEEKNIRLLHSEIMEIVKRSDKDFEVIFVNDGSIDETLNTLRNLSNIVIVDLVRNFGQTAAMAAGIQSANKGFVTFLDGDGQNSPSDILKLVEEYENGELDLVCGWRKNRKDTFLKRFISLGARSLRRRIFGDQIHDSGCTLKILSTHHARKFDLYGELHRFIPILASQQGLRVGEVIVNHRPRIHGKTKYNWRRIFKGYLDMLGIYFWARYATRPLHIFGAFGLLFLGLGSLSLVSWVFLYSTGSTFLKYGMPSLVVLFYFASIQFILIGLLADKLIKGDLRISKDFGYTVRNIERT
jgi:glycosyltransferase involved in cell wall biosynthesis